MTNGNIQFMLKCKIRKDNMVRLHNIDWDNSEANQNLVSTLTSNRYNCNGEPQCLKVKDTKYN